MSIQEETVIPFIVDRKDIPLEAELAFVIGVVGDKIKKGGLFKRTKERLTQVSKFYWRLYFDSVQQRLVVIDSLGVYGGGTPVNDLSLSNVIAHLKAVQDASTLKAFTNNLQDANDTLILNTRNYPLFNHNFSKSTINLAKTSSELARIDKPLILPSFEDSINAEVIGCLNEIPQFSEIKERFQELARQWLAEINAEIENIERTFASKIQSKQDEVQERIERYKERLDNTIDSQLEKANQAIFRELSKFESSTLGLTGMINPIQEHARKILNDIPSIETPKFRENMQSFLSKSKGQIDNIANKVKTLENDRKNLAKALNEITKNFEEAKQKAITDYEVKKANAENELDELRMQRDRSLGDLLEMKDRIKQNTDELCKKMDAVVKNRKDMINKSAFSISGNIPRSILLSLYLIRFQDKKETRYFVIPPLTKPRGGSRIDYPNADRDSALISGKEVADKLAEELVFNRKLKQSFDNLRATNLLTTGEFAGAVKQGLEYLLTNNIISKRTYKKINELLANLMF
ncbi:MAG: hypothetical protein K9W42_04570 [Candidatus Heimdallarchaeota archaeon]|nr:hypothetical protein [Candidatus Heimdallarchaeota archaeon]